MQFERLLHPRGIAVVGASADLTRIGGHPIRALARAGYEGGLFPVNPKYQEIAGRRCYPDLAAVDGPCDVAIVAVPAAAVPETICACGRAGIGFAIVLTAGFRETEADGARLEAELKAAAAEAKVRVIGPNCQGVLSVQDRMWAVFGSVSEEVGLRPGRVSCAFQSGGFGYAIVNLAEAQGVGFRYCVSTGNEADITMPELLSAFLDDPGTDLVFGVMEGTPHARLLLDLGRKSLQLGKPVLIWKSANTDAGAKAAASHTANLTGSYDLYRAACRQSGIIEVDDVEPIVDFAKLAAQGRWPDGNRVGVLSISGGSGIVYADRAVTQGLALPAYSPATVTALKSAIPSFGSVQNPTDVTAGIFNDITILTRTLDVVLADPGIDQLSVLLASIPGQPAQRAAEAIATAAAATTKPVHVGWSGRRNKSKPAYAALEAAKIAVIPTPVRLATAAARLRRFAEDRRRLLPRTPTAAVLPPGLKLPSGTGPLSEVESKKVLAACGVPVTREVLVHSEAEMAALTEGFKPPFAVKVVSPDIAHKTEIGGVLLGIDSGPALEEAFRIVTAQAREGVPSARIDGVLVAEMASGLEMLIGAVNDAVFGPAVALGLGGVLAEAMRDVTHRIAPFDLETAQEMIGELKAARLFDAYRGNPPRDRDALARLLVSVSVLAAALGPRLHEFDVNPVFVRARGRGVVAADALIVLR